MSSHNFGSIAVGATATYKLYLMNNQAVPLNITAITTTGDYSQTNKCVSPLGAGKDCAIVVKFTQNTIGTRSEF